MPDRFIAHNWGTTTLGDCLAVVGTLLRPGRLVDGPRIREYERAFAERIGATDAVSFASGRLGLYFILKALGVGPGDEVLVQVPTHIVVANAIRFTGATPIYVDCTTSDYNMDLDVAAARITPRSRVLVLQHTFGIPVDLDAAQALAAEHGLDIVEDCVHALGSRSNGRPLGSFGRAAFFSTEETKTISSAMGGMAVTSDAELAASLRRFQEQCSAPTRLMVARHLVQQVVYHLATHPAIHRFTEPIYDRARKRLQLGITPGTTSASETGGRRPSDYEMRFSNGQATVALRQLRRLDANVAHRRTIAARYIEELPTLGFTIPAPPAGSDPVYVRFPIRVADREEADRVADRRFVLGRWFNSVLQLSNHPGVAGYVPGTCPRAEQLTSELMNLPTHPRMTEADLPGLFELLGRIRPAAPEPSTDHVAGA
jgi:dTDP-4-amino-4,6-dideoxygalactose transaminase